MLNCTTTNYVACMRRLKPEVIVQAWAQFNGLSFAPYVGDDLFPKHIMPALREGLFKKSVPLLSGGHPMEYITSFDASCVRIFGYNETQNYTLTSDDVKDCFTETFPNDTQLVDGAIKHYLKGVNQSDSRALQRVTALALGHYLFTCPTYFASSIIARQRDSSDVFSYYLPYGTQQTTVYCTNRTWARPCHGEERYGSFGTAFREPELYNDTDRTYTTQMIRVWSTFAATGKPPTMGGYRWPAYQDPPLAPLAPSNMGASDRPIWPSYMVVTPLGPQVAPLYKQYTDCDKFWSNHIEIYNQSSIPTT
ncbi:Acetylcholinesterase-1 [Halotydeus destructor]|nr:Acetylcholinesterase-1 [Halotydeus destructor]